MRRVGGLQGGVAPTSRDGLVDRVAGGDGLVDGPVLPVLETPVKRHRVAVHTGGGEPGRQIIGDDDGEQRVTGREQRAARAEQLASAV